MKSFLIAVFTAALSMAWALAQTPTQTPQPVSSGSLQVPEPTFGGSVSGATSARPNHPLSAIAAKGDRTHRTTPSPTPEQEEAVPTWASRIELTQVDLTLEGKPDSEREVSCGARLYSGLDQTGTCLAHKDQALAILRFLPGEFSKAKQVVIFCDDHARYWTFNCGSRQILYDAVTRKTLMDNLNKEFNEEDEKGSIWVDLSVSPGGNFVTKTPIGYEDYGDSEVYLLPSLEKAGKIFGYYGGDLGNDQRFLRGYSGDPEAAQGAVEVVMDLEHPGKLLKGKAALERMKAIEFGRLAWVPSARQYLGSLKEGETAFYDPEKFQPTRKFPHLSGDRYYASGSGRVLCAIGTGYLTLENTETGKEKSYVLGGENGEWLFEKSPGALPDTVRRMTGHHKVVKGQRAGGAPTFELKLTQRVNLRTLQVEKIAGMDDPEGMAMITGSRYFGQMDSWPTQVFASGDGRGLWVAFLRRDTEKLTFVYFDEDLEPRGLAFLSQGGWLGDWTYVPAARSTFLRNRDHQILRADFPTVPASHFSLFQPPTGLALPAQSSQVAALPVNGLPITMDMAFQHTPAAILADPKGFFYLAENTTQVDQSRILKLDPQMRKQGQWLLPGKPKINLTALALGGDGTLYALDDANRRILKINPQTGLEKEWPFPGPPLGKLVGTGYLASLGVDREGFVYALDGNQGRVAVFDHEGSLVGQWDSNIAPNIQGGQQMAVGPQGEVYLLQAGLHLSRYDREGKLRWRVGGYGNLDSEFTDFNGITVDEAGNVYVRDKGDWVVKEFDPEGNPLQKYPQSSLAIPADRPNSWNCLAVLDGKVYIPYIDNVTVVPANH